MIYLKTHILFNLLYLVEQIHDAEKNPIKSSELKIQIGVN